MKNNITYKESEHKINNNLSLYKVLWDDEKDNRIYKESNFFEHIIFFV